MYKIKPKDIEEVHWKTFDQNMKGIVKETILKMNQRNISFSEENLKIEMDMGKKEWSKFGSKVLKFIKEENLLNDKKDEEMKPEIKEEEEDSKKKRKLNEDSIIDSSSTITTEVGLTTEGIEEEEEMKKKKLKF